MCRAYVGEIQQEQVRASIQEALTVQADYCGEAGSL